MGEFKTILFDLLSSHAGMQEIVNAGAREMGRALWLMNQAYLPLYFSEEPGAEAIWNRFFAQEGQLDRQLLSWEEDGHLAAMYQREDVVHHYNALLGCTVTCGNAVGLDGRRMYLAVFTPGEAGEGEGEEIGEGAQKQTLPAKETVEALLRAISLCMDAKGRGENGSPAQAVLFSLLEGVIPPKGNLALAGFSPEKEYRLFYAMGKRKAASGYLQFLAGGLSSHLQTGLCAVYGEGIMCLAEGEEEGREVLTKLLSSEYCLGVSRPFRGERWVKAYGRQAREAARVGVRDGLRFVSYEDIALADIAGNLNREGEGEAFCSPCLLRVAAYDREYHTEYVHTLRVFLERSGNRKETCLQLGIHANTLKYRLSQMRSLFGMDVTDLREAGKLELSLALLEQQPLPPSP